MVARATLMVARAATEVTTVVELTSSSCTLD